MTPETWLMILAAIFGSNGLTYALAYWLRSRSDTQKIHAESDKDARIKHLEIQLEEAKTRHEKSGSDERQTDKLIASNNQLLVMLGETVNHLRGVEKARETDYQTLKSISDRNALEIREFVRRLVGELQRNTALYVGGLLDNHRKQMLTHDVYQPITSPFPVAPEHDCNWHRVIITFHHASKIHLLKSPLHLNDDVMGFISSGDEVYMIDNAHRPEIVGWAQVRLIDMPEAAGWVELWNITYQPSGLVK